MILVLYHDNGRIVGLYPNGEIKGRDIYCRGRRVASNVKANWDYIPDQDLGALYTEDESGAIVLSGRFPDDVMLFSAEEQAQLVDRDTGKAIDEAIHPFAGLEEQIGILRDQLVHIVNELGLAPTADFERLNSIAVSKIEEGAKKKEALNAEDDKN